MAEHAEQAKAASKESMMAELFQDSSRAFINDLNPNNAQQRVEANANWWRGLTKQDAPATLHSLDIEGLEKKGYKVSEDQYYKRISRDSADGKLHEDNIYSKDSKQRLSTTFLRYENKEDLKTGNYQSVDLSYGNDGVSASYLRVKSGNYLGEFNARFNKDGTLQSARQWGRDIDSTEYSFREDGSLYQQLTRSNKDSAVLNDQLFDSAGKPRSDYNPLYLYEKLKRPVENLYMGLRELRRSGGLF